jgi:hypothetical protein
MLTPIHDVDAHRATRTAWHTLAERVLAPARHAATGHIGLRPAPGGFTTGVLGDGRAISVTGTDLVLATGGQHRRTALTTLGAAAAFVGTAPDADTGVYPTTTPTDPATDLAVDAAPAAALAAWIAFGDAVLRDWATTHADETPAEVQLWPEHFDLGTDLGPDDARRANYGASPGDAGYALPYLYVGPWSKSDDPFWDAGSYARLPYETLAGVDDPGAVAATFLRAGHEIASSPKS